MNSAGANRASLCSEGVHAALYEDPTIPPASVSNYLRANVSSRVFVSLFERESGISGSRSRLTSLVLAEKPNHDVIDSK